MANRYANLVGSNKIKDEWTKINAGFDAVQADMDAKADADDLVSLENTVNDHIGAGGNAHAVATDQQAGFMSAQDKQKLDGVEAGAQVNQNAFAKVNDLEATDPTDELTITGGTGIAITTNPNTKEVIVTATGEATPGPHGPSHTEHGADPIPTATSVEGGLMSAEHVQMLESHDQRIGEVEDDLNDIKTHWILQGEATITSTPSNGYFRDFEPFVEISLPEVSLDTSNYGVLITPTLYDDLGRVGQLIAYDKTQNGFKVKMTGSASTVTFIWTLVNPRV